MRLVAVLALAAVVTAGCGSAHAPKRAEPRAAAAASAPAATQGGAPAVPSGPGRLHLEAQTTVAGRPQPMLETVSASVTADGAMQWTWTEGGSMRPETQTYRTAGTSFEVRTTSGSWAPTDSVHGVASAVQNLWGSTRPGDVLPDLVAATVDWRPTTAGWAGSITEDSSVDAIVRGFQRLYKRHGVPWTARDAEAASKIQRDAIWHRLAGGHDLAVTWTKAAGGGVSFSVRGESVQITGSWTPTH